MSLNEFFAANPSGVYLRPVGLSDCFSMPGLPHGCKPPPPPPPLAMQHPCPPGPQKPRTMAAVSPLHQVTPPQSNLTAYEAATANSLNAFGSSQRTSSFAAALRKLAKQAGDPITGEKDISQISPVSSPALAAQRSLTPKRNGSSAGQNQSMYLNSNNVHQVSTSYPSSSPPVVTIAPSRPHPTHTTSDSRKLQVMDLAGISQSNQNSSVTNGHLSDPISLKLDVAKSTNRSSAGGEKWDEHATSKSLPTSSGSSSQSRPHATIAPLPRPDDSLTSSRGFQPYRSADDIRTSMPPHHLSPFEPHPQASYPYAPAFLPPPHLPHPAYRFDDPLFLDRFGLLRSPVMPFHAQPAMMATPAAFYPQSRYDLLAQTLSLSSGSLHLQERLKLEEERRQREKEAELDLSRKREQERREKEQKEKEQQQQQQQQHKEKERRDKDKTHRGAEKIDHHPDSIARTNHHHHHQHHPTPGHSKRSETLPRRSDQHLASAINRTPPPVTSSSTPLNLVVQPTASEQHPKKETELWIPWQQQQQQHHSHHPHHHQPHLNNNHEETPPNMHVYRTPPQPVAIHTTQIENHQISHPPKDQQPNEKFQPPFGFPMYGEKKGIPATEANSLILDNDQKRPAQPIPVIPPIDIADAKRTFPLVGPNSNNFVNNSNSSHGNGNYKKFDSIHHHIAELSKKDNNTTVGSNSNISTTTTNEWKHEKLQKAYANNHRKSVTEVKKYREESQQLNSSNCITNANNGLVNGSSSSHFVTQQQRKQHQQPQHINGLVKPTLSQDEGMHARLLETEKCRLEYSNHSVNKILPIPPPPTVTAVPNDKLSIQNMVQTSNHQLVNGSDPGSQLYIEHHIMSMLNKKNVEIPSVPVRSKLDKEAEDMKKKGYMDGECDEINLKEFLIITKGPPLPLDDNPKKMDFLEIFGLTSRIKRKQIELDIYLKRQKVLHEDENCLPLQMEPEPSSLPDGTAFLESFRNLDKVSERLRCEGGAEKSEFFLNLGLSPLSKMQKEERNKLRNIAEDEKRRRAQRLLGKESSQSTHKSKSENDDSKTEAVATAGRQLLKPVSISSAKTIQLSLNSSLQVPYSSATAKDESVNGGQALAANSGSSSFVLPQEPYDFKRNKFRTKYSFKRGHSLKCEWKPATTLTPQNNHSRADFGASFVKTESKAIVSKSISTQADLSLNNGDENKSSFNWPGLDAVIEAYYRHHKDQLIEKELLKERCSQLKGRQEDLTKEANQLSRSMSDLLKQKRDQDEKKLQLEQALQKLKHFIQAAR